MTNRVTLSGPNIAINGRVAGRPLSARAAVACEVYLAFPGQFVNDEMISKALHRHRFAGSTSATTDAIDEVRRAFGDIQLSICWKRERGSGWVFTPPAAKGSGGNNGDDDDRAEGTPVEGRRRIFWGPKFDFPLPEFSLIRESDRMRY